MATQNAPVETKVWASSAATAVATFIMSWLIFKAPGLSSWSGPIQAAITAALTSAATFVAGWVARHTPRPGDNPPAPKGL